MSLTHADIHKIAHLARLDIEDNKLDALTQDLNQIMDLVATMSETDTAHIEPLAHPLDEKQTLRPDQITETNQREHFQQIAPAVKAGLYIVPQVIDSE